MDNDEQLVREAGGMTQAEILLRPNYGLTYRQDTPTQLWLPENILIFRRPPAKAPDGETRDVLKL